MNLFRVDWLHAVDQGVGADFAGGAFEALLPKLPQEPVRMLGAMFSMTSCKLFMKGEVWKIGSRC